MGLIIHFVLLQIEGKKNTELKTIILQLTKPLVKSFSDFLSPNGFVKTVIFYVLYF